MRLLTSREFAEVLGISTRTVRLWAELDEIPAVRIGRQWRFRASEIASWLDLGRNNGQGSRIVYPSADSPSERRLHPDAAKLLKENTQDRRAILLGHNTK